MFNLSEIAVVIQGPIKNIRRHMDLWPESCLVLFSTCDDFEERIGADVITLQSDRPEDNGVGNINLQKITTLSGLNIAQKYDYKYSIKIRSDLFPTNARTLIDSLDLEKLNFIAKHRDRIDGYDGYLVDYFQAGKTDDLIKLWDIKDIHSNSIAETALMNNFSKNFKPEDVSFFLDKLNSSNDLWWERSKIFISSYKHDPAYRTYW